MSKGEVTRAAILDKAVARASVHGLEGLSIGGLANLTGLSKSGLFGHFGSKEALQRAVLEAVVEDFIASVIAPALKQPTGLKRLQTLFKLWLDWAEADPWTGGCPLLAASFELDDKPGALRDYLAAQQSGWLDSIARMAKRAIEDGDFRKNLDAAQFAFEFHNIGLGFSFASRLLHDPKSRERAAAAFKSLSANARS
jgi:AcrR family transcriptional regulator